MLDKTLYEMIFKRKSFHLFRNVGEETLSSEELKNIEDYFYTLTPLVPEIKVKIRITNNTTCHRGQEYCICFYSEIKDNYLQNIGYLGEQLDLYLVKRNIGTLWFGIGKVKEEKLDGLDYVIMIAIKKISDISCYRKDMFKSKRKALSEVWDCDDKQEIGNIVRFAPSACNTQPWYVKKVDGIYNVYRYKKQGIRGIMPAKLVTFYNRIDVGIFLCFLEIVLLKEGIEYSRTLYVENNENKEYNLTASYKLLGE